MTMFDRTKDSNATVIAFAYALSSALVWARRELQVALDVDSNRVCCIDVMTEEAAQVVRALAGLCGRVCPVLGFFL